VSNLNLEVSPSGIVEMLSERILRLETIEKEYQRLKEMIYVAVEENKITGDIEVLISKQARFSSLDWMEVLRMAKFKPSAPANEVSE
jgi:hypothetical protein